MSTQANWSYPTAIRFGAGRIRELAQACREAGMARPLLVTDRGLAELPMVAIARQILAEAGLGDALFSGVDPNPNEHNLASGLAAYRDGEHDGVIAMGGGSGLDLGKLVAFMAGQQRPVWDFEDVDDWWSRADPAGIAPIVAVPTTAGTGAEVGRAGVLSNSATSEKKIIFHPQILPSQVICDPQLTLSMPPAITAGTGLDAFAHCLEAYCAPNYHPLSHGIAVEGMRLVRENLSRVYADGSDIEARGHMMSAALMGATAFQKGLGAIHALSHPLGAIYNIHHGTTNAVVMPAVLNFNRPMIELGIERLAAYLEIDGGFDGFHAYLLALNEQLGIPENLRAMGVVDPDIDALVAAALSDPSAGGNPVTMTAENTWALIEACL
ncbi:alcohol dehydrogenase [Halioglobus japonicus]|uniref:Alcohol dehydrogenase n=1 Tax=Halioglobus japonicus TaxID=930805 RepID=A0AAP8SQ08_9GAMM|nr:iron-containing alcohol dehydrogenase [Halioglobus japonicus]AQA19226.1 alcohol dehydrogenase [Halioglobus japonicus]PLW87738.1 alcohol dehydrogenase [Halioglobus japonicus]GHD06858.1 dehydrogenase [Halioglobus japonicus]